MKSFIALTLAAIVAADAAADAQAREDTFAQKQLEIDQKAMSFEMLTKDKGFKTPESMFWDKDSDTTFISNINLPHDAKAGNGFISKLTGKGGDRKLELKWLAKDLDAPKGLWADKTNLWVTDIDVVKCFDKATGELKKTFAFKGSEFLNDIRGDAAGNLYISDSGLNGKGVSSGGKKDAIYKLTKDGDDYKQETIVKSKNLQIPNGIWAVDENELVVTSFKDAGLYNVNQKTGKMGASTKVAGQIDGIERNETGTYFISSWVSSTSESTTATSGSIRFGQMGKEFQVLIDGINAPADIGLNALTNELYVPMFKDDEVRIYPLDKWATDRRTCTRACKTAADAAFKKDKKDDMTIWETCNNDCNAKFTGATFLTLGAAFATMAVTLF